MCIEAAREVVEKHLQKRVEERIRHHAIVVRANQHRLSLDAQVAVELSQGRVEDAILFLRRCSGDNYTED